MSVLGNIMSAIFGNKTESKTPTTPQSGTTIEGKPTAGKVLTEAQVEEMIEKIADEQDQDYNWDTSIVDLMKLLKLDSSLTARKELAKELGYKGELNGSAEMNIWLHKQVMVKLAESGGVVSDSLRPRA